MVVKVRGELFERLKVTSRPRSRAEPACRPMTEPLAVRDADPRFGHRSWRCTASISRTSSLRRRRSPPTGLEAAPWRWQSGGFGGGRPPEDIQAGPIPTARTADSPRLGGLG